MMTNTLCFLSAREAHSKFDLATIKLEHTRLTRSFSPRKLPVERTGHLICMEQEAVIRTDWEATDDETLLISLIELISEMGIEEDEQVACNG